MTSAAPDEAVGYVFGYATIADPDDHLVVRAASDRPAVEGKVRGFRRVWDAAVENRAAAADHKHYVDRVTGERPDVVVVTLNIEPDADAAVNGIAVPVDEPMLRLFDRREYFLERIDVTDRFSRDLGLPVWAYTATPESVALYRSARADGRAVIRKSYLERVMKTFRALGPDALRDFERWTSPPECPIADLEIVRAPGDAGV
jgi:hypothetical protein